jgi:type IV secretory pathway TrbD component
MNADNRRLNIIHQSLIKPVLVIGAERNLAFVNWVTAFGLLLPWKGWYAAGAAILLMTVGHGMLVYLAKLDPNFSEVYVRNLRLRQDYYPARASIWSLPPSPFPAIVGCWLVAAFMGSWLWILLRHALWIFTICALPAAYGTWHFATASPIRPTIPSRRSWF